MIEYLSNQDAEQKRDFVLITPQAPLINNIALKISLMIKRAIVEHRDNVSEQEPNRSSSGIAVITKSLEMLLPTDKKAVKNMHPSMASLV